MAYARRNTTLDIWNNRCWTADAISDLASIPARHGDTAYVTANSHVYGYFDTVGWMNLSPILGVDISGFATGRIPYVSSGALGFTLAGGLRDVFCGQNGLGFPHWDSTPAVEGINFPAAQVASADANTLDDYEEGTFTPAITFGGAAVGVTYSVQEGTYVKVGKKVTINVRVIVTAKGSSTGTLLITGLPFAQASTNAQAALAVGYYSGFNAGAYPPICYIGTGGSTISPLKPAATPAVVTDADLGAAFDLMVSGSYFV